MVTNVFFATTILFMAVGFLLLDQCRFLIPYRTLLLQQYGTQILLFAAVLWPLAVGIVAGGAAMGFLAFMMITLNH